MYGFTKFLIIKYDEYFRCKLYKLGIIFFLQEAKKSEKPLLVQKTNDYLQSLRVKWEEKERDLLSKDKDIHYQDVLYDGESIVYNSYACSINRQNVTV